MTLLLGGSSLLLTNDVTEGDRRRPTLVLLEYTLGFGLPTLDMLPLVDGFSQQKLVSKYSLVGFL